MKKIIGKAIRTFLVAALAAVMWTTPARADDGKEVKLKDGTEVYYESTAYMWDSAASFRIDIKVPKEKKGAVYTVSVSNPKVAEFIQGSQSNVPDDITANAKTASFATFKFWTKKTGNVKVTLRETYKGKTKKLITCPIKVKKDSYFRDDKESKTKLKFLKKKISKIYNGVSLEVVGVKSAKRGKKYTTITLELDHPVTTMELKAAGKSASIPSYFNATKNGRIVDSRYGNGYPMKLVKGKKTAVIVAKNSASNLKKGVTLHFGSYSRKKGSVTDHTITLK